MTCLVVDLLLCFSIDAIMTNYGGAAVVLDSWNLASSPFFLFFSLLLSHFFLLTSLYRLEAFRRIITKTFNV